MAKAAKPDAPKDKVESASSWMKDIDAALKREKTWREKAKEVVQRYRDERGKNASESRVNILWSNTEVLKSALYARTAKPDVRRRFPDTAEGNAVSRAAAEVVERSVIYANDVGEVDDPISAAIDDVLLPGRGTCWVSYEPEIEGDEGYGVENEAGDGRGAVHTGQRVEYRGVETNEGGAGPDIATTPRITSQKLTLDYVYWEDFTHGKARKWCDVPWVARRHVLRKEQFKAKFPDAKEGALLDYKLEDAGGETDEGPEHVEVWEIWDRPSNRRLYIGRGYAGVLQTDDDPYGLTGLFPCPKPMTSVTTTDRLVPSPEFLQYQDQANELDVIATRVTRLLEQMQFKGGFDATTGGDKGELNDISKAGDGEFIPMQNWQGLKEKGGIEGVFAFWPIERISPIIAQLTDRAQRLTQQIYEVTGISDIIRGSTDPNETKGAQQLKAQFGSMRMQARQRDVQRFIRDCYRMEAEIIAEHFTVDTLKGITGLTFQDSKMPSLPPPSPQLAAQGGPAPQPMVPPPMAQGGMSPQGIPGEMPQRPDAGKPAPEKPTWDAIMAILRSDKMRGYRIDIETDATVMEDAEAEKASRIEFMGAVNDMLEKAYIAATTAPMMLPLIRETFLFGIRSFKVGRALEQAAEDAFDELIKNPPQAPQAEAPAPTGPDPEVEKAKLTIEGEKVKADVTHKSALFDLEKQKTEHDMVLKEKQFQLSVAAQNKQIFDEAQAEIDEAAEASQDPATPAQPGQSPIELMLAGIQQLAMAISQGQALQGQQIASLAQAMTAPKRVIRGPDQKVIGVETITPPTLQ